MVVKKNAQVARKTGTVQKTIKKEAAKSDKCGAVSEDFEVDENARYSGKVTMFDRKGGYGFIVLDDEGVVPNNKVMVVWRDIKSSDRWPYLYKDLEVELALIKRRSRGGRNAGWEVKAHDVTMPGGADIAIQDESEEKREYVGEKNMRFTGSVKFYDPVKGFGYCTMEDGYEVPEGVPNELRISREEINAEAKNRPNLRMGMECEFGIYKSPKGIWSCYNITLPGGNLVDNKTVEQREEIKGTFEGTIAFWRADDGFGYVKLKDNKKLPAAAQKVLKESTAKHQSKNKRDGAELDEIIYFKKADRTGRGPLYGGDEIKCRVYTDYRGIGAFDVEVTKSSRA